MAKLLSEVLFAKVGALAGSAGMDAGDLAVLVLERVMHGPKPLVVKRESPRLSTGGALATYLKSHAPYGEAARIARECAVTPVVVSKWAGGVKPVPARRCMQLERITLGFVRCEDQRRDLPWHRVPDPEWPWHEAGRPWCDEPARPAHTPSPATA